MSAVTESAHLIGGQSQLLGILSIPPKDTTIRATGVVILSSGLLHRVGPFRAHVDIARTLARSGFPTVRLDQYGRGDSGHSNHPDHTESISEELMAAQRLLSAKANVGDVIVMGLCSGADDAISLCKLNSNITGIVLLDGIAPRNWRYYLAFMLRRVSNPQRLKRIIRNRVAQAKSFLTGPPRNSGAELEELPVFRDSPELDVTRTSFRDLFDRGGHALCIFTGGVDYYYSYLGQFADGLGIARSEPRLKEVYFPAANHTYPISAHRQQLVETITTWCAECFE